MSSGEIGLLGRITDVAALEACIGKTPSAMNLKVINHIDAGAARWLAASPLMFGAFASKERIDVTLAGGERGFITIPDPTRMRLPIRFLDDPSLACVGKGFGSLFIVPNLDETLRINGRVVSLDPSEIEIAVEECYVHCAKAFIRSDFWNAVPLGEIADKPHDYLATSRFIALATADSAGHADVSPKGDPAGQLIHLADDGVWFADRPGNRRADSFRNILTNPRIALATLIPGTSRIAIAHGDARIARDETIRAKFAVQDKKPLIVTRIEPAQIVMVESAALVRARLWSAKTVDHAIDPASVIVGHVKLSKERGIQASLLRKAVGIPGVMRKGLAHDYKTNLY